MVAVFVTTVPSSASVLGLTVNVTNPWLQDPAPGGRIPASGSEGHPLRSRLFPIRSRALAPMPQTY